MVAQPPAETATVPSPNPEQSEPVKRALARLSQIRRALQRANMRRRGTMIELAALDRAALMTLRAEIAARDPNATSCDVVRLDNAARRARQDFERLANPQRKSNGVTLGDILRQGAHP